MTATKTDRIDIYAQVTARIAEDLERGVRPWVKPENAECRIGNRMASPNDRVGSCRLEISLLMSFESDKMGEWVTGGVDPVGEGERILAEAVEPHRPVKLFALFSGGHDTLCSAHLASRLPRFDGCVHINTGIGIEETREFVRDTCRKHGWPLREYQPPMSYEEIVLRWGFPGPAGHSLVYGRLKERCLRQLVREHKTGRRDRVLLVSGIRRQESRRRMGFDQPVQADGARVWVAPLLNWSHDDKYAYLDAQALDRNPVVERLCMSGECLCGAFARKGELDEIAFWYPQAAARIRALEERAAAVGVPCRWGHKPSKGDRAMSGPAVGLCWSCGAKKDAEEEADTPPGSD